MNLYDFDVKTIEGETISLSEFKGKVVLIVNTASKCGFTPQFKGLEKLYEKYESKGLEILGFPCNQFKEQDPGTNKEIKNFCLINYGVSFRMFEKIDVNGAKRHPLYQHLIDNTPNLSGKDVKWNFEKFLINKDGEIIKRFLSMKTPASIDKIIGKLI
ncbi:MAG: glutathione peroxidase [Clostridiales bacterium]|nr:glutathione peroxidase [Clostridiales bacterium]